jgi:chondroitin AC lyase
MKTLKILNLIFLIFGYVHLSFGAPTDFEIIRQRVVAELMKPPVDDTRIQSLIEEQHPDGTWPGINYQDVSREGFEHRIHLSNMVALGRAYKTKSSRFYKSKKVKSAIDLALKNWVEHDYICDNWWHNQIGTPDQLVTLMLLTGDILPDDLVQKAQPMIGRAHIDAPGARPGGDRIKIAGIQAKNMLFMGDDKTFEKVVRVIESEIKYVEWIGASYGYGYRRVLDGFDNRSEGGRGIQFDNSFHHRADGVNNTLSYGSGYASAFIEWAEYVTGTSYAFSEGQTNRLVDYYLDGICKHLIYGKFPDPGATNRDISREGTLHARDIVQIPKLLRCTNYRRPELEEIQNTRTNGSPSTLSHATFYWNTEHFTVQRPGWFASVRMYSTRNYNMEQPYNSEGLLNHHRGDGTNHISLTGTEYYDIAPVFDYQKVPGTTIVQKPQLPVPEEIQKLGLTDFVGAVTDGKYAAVGFNFKSPHDPLCARKSWFFFDEEYVCLGAGISATKELPVVTTLNQCLLRGDVTLSSQNKYGVIPKGENVFTNVDWVFHDGIGYIFPQPNRVNLMNQEAGGSWWTINKQSDSPKEEVKLDVFKLWINHGNRPSEASYSYIVAPATTIQKLESGSSKTNITILSNTPEIQAVRHSGLNLYQIVFYKSGTVQLGDNLKIACESPGIVMVKTDGSKFISISASDPNRELDKIHISVTAKVEGKSDKLRATWDAGAKMSLITIDLPDDVYAGQSVTAELK